MTSPGPQVIGYGSCSLWSAMEYSRSPKLYRFYKSFRGSSSKEDGLEKTYKEMQFILIDNPLREFYKAATNVIKVSVQIQNESRGLSFPPRVGVAQKRINWWKKLFADHLGWYG